MTKVHLEQTMNIKSLQSTIAEMQGTLDKLQEKKNSVSPEILQNEL